MRVAICNWSRRRVGGTEAYIAGIIPELAAAGDEIAFLHESDGPVDREEIALPRGAPAWCSDVIGAEGALAALAAWRPDVIYSHIIESRDFEAQLLDIAPAVFDAHAYYGTCISGLKTFKNPVVQPCSRRFGWKCLLHYYPHRCGGLSPVTMWRLFRAESQRLELLSRYRAVITHSEHMRLEYVRHDLRPDRVFNLSAVASDAGEASDAGDMGDMDDMGVSDQPLRLLFVGRMDSLKGGDVLLAALPEVRSGVGRPVRVVFAGDGPARTSWERKAARARARDPGVEIDFVGWVSGSPLNALFAASDLLVVPSLWPEPFGRVGIEAGTFGVPAAAFAVGGIPEWLVDGVNGHLARSDPPTAAGLADAILKCVMHAVHYAHLQRGAVERARVLTAPNRTAHVREILAQAAEPATINALEARATPQVLTSDGET